MVSKAGAGASTIKYVILDRDGTLIRHVPYLHDPGRVELLSTVRGGLATLVDHGCLLFLHTNQSGIGRGYFSISDAIACNDEMLRQIGMGPSLFEDIRICPEGPNDPVCYRKPSPKYGLEILSRYGADPAELCYIGDNVTDLLAARHIGCAGLGVDTGLHDLNSMLAENGLAGAFPVFSCFAHAARAVVGLQPVSA